MASSISIYTGAVIKQIETARGAREVRQKKLTTTKLTLQPKLKFVMDLLETPHFFRFLKLGQLNQKFDPFF